MNKRSTSKNSEATINLVPVWLRWLVPSVLILVWVVGAAIGGPYFGKIGDVAENNLTSFLPDDADSTQVQQRLSEFVAGDSIPAVVVFAGEGELSPEQLAALSELRDELTTGEGVVGAASPLIPSEDGQAAQVVVPLDTNREVKDDVALMQEQIVAGLPDDVSGHVSGPAGFTADLTAAFGAIDGILLATALSVVFVILVIVYRSPFLPFVVLMTSVFALAVSIIIVWHLANAGIVQLNGQVQGILFILVIGAATDYSLLYVARYREELRRYTDTFEATRATWRGAVEPIMASGGTVIVGLMCMMLSELGSNQALGPIGSIGIVLSMTAALTFLPAVLLLAGRRIFWPFMPRIRTSGEKKVTGIWPRIAQFVDTHPRRIWVVSTVALVVMAVGLVGLKADGVPQSEYIVGPSQARDGQAVLAKHFAEGTGSPMIIVGPETTFQAMTEALTRDGVDSIAIASKASPAGVVPLATDTPEQLFAQVPPTVSQGDIMLQATLADAQDSQAAQDTVRVVRDDLRALDESIVVGGVTATTIDTNEASQRDLAVIMPTVLAAIVVILIILLRALVAPILLVLSTAISFAAALGVAAVLFNLLGMPGADPAVPLFGFIFLVALGIDYNIFLMTRVREESLRLGTRAGVVKGLTVTGGVITSAGVVLAATFAALSVIPILFLTQIAFIVAFGVLLDTLLVRSLLTPGLIIDIDRYAWWPSRLSHKKRTSK